MGLWKGVSALGGVVLCKSIYSISPFLPKKWVVKK